MNQDNENYWSGSDSYQYPNSEVLKNIPEIKNQEDLDLFEKNIIRLVLLKFPDAIKNDVVDLNLWKKIHKIFFDKVFSWAGQIRTVQMAKGTTMFAHPEYIESSAKEIFNDLKKENYLTSLDKENLCERLAYYFCELNMLHPFREGNGRTQRILFSEIARRCGYDIQWFKTEATSKEQIEASIAGTKCNYLPMTEIFNDIIVKSA
ncbi:MAG: Fic family protein [Rickettsiales bacterium]|nr:Fic family protein [Rickettsiales bacterium]